MPDQATEGEARQRISNDDLVSFVPMEDLGIGQKDLVSTQVKPLSEVVGSYTYFADGDVLLARIIPCFENGKLGIAAGLSNGIGFGSSEYVVFRPSQSIDKNWLYYFLSRESFRKEGAERMSGAVGHKRVAKEFIEAYPIPLPPLPEQKRIVSILDEALEGIGTAVANAEKNLANARELFESYLQTAFDNGEEYVRLSELATDITDGDHAPPPKAASGVPFITISDIVKPTRTINFSNTFFVPQEYFRNLKPNKKPRPGDVLYTVTGATLGIPVLVKQEIDFCFQRHIGLIRPKPETDSVWLSYALLSPQVFRQATLGSTGAAQKTVSLALLRSITVPKVRVSEQRLIAVKLDALTAETQHLEFLYQRKLVALETLKQAILQKAFAGELTAQPDQAPREAAA
jgi:type I restriction enzyme, S subunit